MNKWWWVKRAVRWLFFAFRSRKIVVSCHWVKNRNFLWYNSVDAYALVRTVFCRSNRKKTKLKIEWCGNVNRLFDTKGMNRILGKPLKTRGFGILGVVGIPCLFLGLCQGNMGAAVTDWMWPLWSRFWPLPLLSVTSLCLREFMWMKNVQYPWTIFNSRPGGNSEIMP